jgi:hypothetical protein
VAIEFRAYFKHQLLRPPDQPRGFNPSFPKYGTEVFLAELVSVGGSLLSTSVMIGLKSLRATATAAERLTLDATR